jgi:hypothetical protein
VKADSTGANTGSSWSDAFRDLQSALNLAKSGDEIWVAKGIYKPTAVNPLDTQFDNGSDPRAKTFYLKEGVKLYGGFEGTETSREVRTNETVLSGDFRDNDIWPVTEQNKSSYYYNAYNVVVAYKLASTTIIDGFTIKGGYAGPNPDLLSVDYDPWNDPHAHGGGIASWGSNLLLENCTVTRNAALMAGGGIFAFSGNSTVPTLSRTSRQIDIRGTVFEENIVPDYRLNEGIFYAPGGGGLFLGDSYTARFFEVEFLSNSAPNGGALAMSQDEDQGASTAPSATANRCLFYSNQALCSPDDPETPADAWITDGMGGALCINEYARLALNACAFVSNAASSNGYSTQPQPPNPNEGTRYGGNGGAVFVGEGAVLKAANSGFISNTADWGGGAANVGTWSGRSATALEIYYCTLYGNQARWGAGLCNFAAVLTGYGNIVYKNWSVNSYYNDLANTVQVSSKSSIKESVFTYSWTVNYNTGVIYYFDNQSPLPEIFVNPANAAGADGEWGTGDDGFRLLGGSLPNGKVSSRPPDFADADNDGNFSEPLPTDAQGSVFGSAPFDCGPYQGP